MSFLLYAEARILLRLWRFQLVLIRSHRTATEPVYSAISIAWAAPGWELSRTWAEVRGPVRTLPEQPRINALPLGDDGPTTVRSAR